jgi:SNF family Na+-dependent transporter
MNKYNKVMLYVWLFIAVASFIIVTIMGFKEGFDRWSSSYVLSAIALLMFFVRKWMMNRMQKHMDYLNSSKEK